MKELQTARGVHRETFKRTFLAGYRRQNFKMDPKIPGPLVYSSCLIPATVRRMNFTPVIRLYVTVALK